MHKYTSTIIILLGFFLYGNGYGQTVHIDEQFPEEGTNVVSSTTYFTNSILVSDNIGRLQKGAESLTSHLYPLSGTCTELTLSFDHYCSIDVADQAIVQYRTNGATGTWITLTNANYFGGWSNYVDRFTEASYATWNTTNLQTEEFKINNLNGVNSIEIRFLIEDLDGSTLDAFEKWYLDNILLTEESFDNSTMDFSIPTSACTGTQLMVSGLNIPPCTDPTTISWLIKNTTTGSLVTQTGYEPNHVFTESGNYEITLTIGTTSVIHNVDVQNSPGSLTITESTTNCGQVEITFPAGVNTGAPGRIFSYGDGTYNSGVYSNNAFVHTYTANGSYTVSFTSESSGCPIYGIAEVTGLPESNFSYTIIDECDYQQGISLTIVDFDASTYNYQWDINGSVMGATQATDTYTQGLQAGNNIIKLKVFSNGYSCMAQSSSQVSLGTNLANIELFGFDNDNNFCQYDLLNFSYVSDIPDTYNWTIYSITDGTSHSTAQYPHYVFAHPESYGISLEASINGCPSVVYPEQTNTTLYEIVTVFETHDLSFTASPNAAVCGEYEVTFNNLPSNAQVVLDYGDGTGPTTSLSHTYTANGIYEITASIANGVCEDAFTKNVHVNVGATVALTATDLFICEGVSTTLTANVTGVNGLGNLTYTWSLNGMPTPALGNGSSILVSEEGVYTVGVGSSNGICFLGSGNSASIIINKALIPQATVSSTIGAGCGNTGEAILAISNFEAVGYNLYGDVSLDNTVTVDGLSAGTYHLTIASEHNHSCFSTTEITIDGSNLVVNAIETATSSCTSNTGEIAITATGGDGNYTIDIIDGSNNVTSNVGNSVNNLAPGIYTINVTDGTNCTATTTVAVGTTPVNFTVDVPNTGLCPDEASTVTVSATATGNVTYEWLGDPNETGTNVVIATPGVYQVVGSIDGCTLTQSFTVEAAPQVGITIVSDGQQCVGQEAVVTATLSGGTYDNITWTNATPDTDPLEAKVTNFPSTVSATIQIGGCTYQSNDLTLNSVTEVVSDWAATDHYDDTQNCLFASQASGGTAPYTYNWYLQNQTVTTYGDPSDPNDNTTELQGQEVLQVSFSENTSINNMVDGTYSFQIVDANGCTSQVYGPITYTVPENTAAYPGFSFVWGEEVIEEEENEEVDEVLREDMAEAADAIMDAAGECYENNVAVALTNFRTSCFQDGSLKDELSVRYDENIHHYTLFYYDRAGMLTQTVPPEGVDILDETAVDNILNYRQGIPGYDLATVQQVVPNLLPDHNLRTHYWYNNLGQMIRQYTEDGGETNFIYDDLSRLRFSQNAKQKENNAYSYTKYDELGRVIEAGQSTLLTYTDPTDNTTYTLDFDNTFNTTNNLPSKDLLFPNAQTEQVTYSVYTTPAQVTYYGQAQRYLQNRISYVYSDYDGDLATAEDQYYTYYSYDPHGNVEWLVQDDPEIGENYIAYEYDLISGKVLKVKYNEQRADRFYHRYNYDAENRLTGVETSINGEIWDEDATYQYYLHGPLMRSVIGEDQVQGIDYAYTIQGWLKAMNTAQLHRGANTMRNDGSDVATAWETDLVAKDAYGMTLGYFHGDYKNTTHDYLTDNTNNLYTAVEARDLYNGNISHWINSRLKQTGVNTAITESAYTNATIYRYDVLNRIKESWNFEQSKADQNLGFKKGYENNNEDLAFHTNYTYDANGNLTTLNRYNETGTLMDDLTYGYNIAGNGRLENNRLASVSDGVTGMFAGVQDIVGNRTYNSNTAYDEIGNLIHDVADEWIDGIKHTVTTDIEWNVSGKIKAIKEKVVLHNTTDLKQLKYISFEYDPLGNRTRKTAKISEYLSTGNYNGQAPETYAYGVEEIQTTYYVRDAQGNPMAVYNKKYDTDANKAELWVQEQTIYGSDRVGLYTRPQTGEPLAEAVIQNGEEVSFAGAVETGVEAISEYQNWITSSTLPSAAIENICQCDIKKMNYDGSNYNDNGSLTSFLGIADKGIAIAENTDHETQFYAVLAKNYLGNEDACLVYDSEGKLMKGVEQITDVNMNSRPVIINITGTNKYALITLTNQGVPTYHIIDMDQYGYGGVDAMGEVTNIVNQPLTSLSNTANVQYGYHYTGYEDHVNHKTIVYTTRTTPLVGQSEKLVEVVAVELGENAPITEHVLWSTVQCAEGDMGELQIAPNGEKLVWYNHGKNIAGFDHKQATIYEIALNSDKISSTGLMTNVTKGGGSFAPLSGADYQKDSENILFTQHDLYNATSNTSGAKLWKYDQLNITDLMLSQNLVYLLGDIRRGLNGNLYIPNIYESGADVHNYTTIGGVANASGFFTPSTPEERLTGTLPTQVYKLVGNDEDVHYRVVGNKSYELKDHLGNVRAVVTDHKILEDENNNDVIDAGDYYSANIVSYSDYYPFGMLMPGRNGGSEEYRYNFQGQETDDEIKGKGNSVNYKYRMHDPRLGRFFAVDPLTSKYPHYTPYSFSGNKVIHAVELEGLEESVLSSVEYSNRPYVHQLKRGDTYWSIAAKLDNVSSDDLIRWNPSKPKNQLHKYIGSYIHTSNPEGVTIEDIPDDVLNEDFRFQLSEESQQKMVNDMRTENMLDFAFNFGWFFTGMTAGAVAPPARPSYTSPGFRPSYRIKVDLMGGKQGTKGYINYDLEAQGFGNIADDVVNFGKYFKSNSVNEMIVNNPQASFLNEVTPSMKSGSTITIRGTMNNKFFNKVFNGKAQGLENYKVSSKKTGLPNDGYKKTDGRPIEGTNNINEIILIKL